MKDAGEATARRRLEQIRSIVTDEKHVLDLPDSAHLTLRNPDGSESSSFYTDGRPILVIRVLPREATLVLSALGTAFEKNHPVPSYPVLELELTTVARSDVESNADLWSAIYGLWTLLHEQEVIPIAFNKLPEHAVDYLLRSGLARRAVDPGVHELFLSRTTFWQGAGTGPAWMHTSGWLRYALDYAPFPHVQTFTRSPTVIAQHPLRPPKPPPGTTVYARYCVPIGKALRIHVIDPKSKDDMDAFHRWMNDPRVNAGWGEAGDEEKHRRYVGNMWVEPSVLPLIMSWNDERMGYAELVWIKENHVATFVPGIGAQDHDRGLHVLVGEDKYRGQDFSQAWFRSLSHYIFLADPRTTRIIGEPRRNNAPIIKTSCDAGMHLETKSFYFPYKHSAMTMNLRERLFKEDMFL